MDRLLLEYLPVFMQEYLEIQEIMKTEQLELERIERKIYQVLDNEFIQSCDMNGIQRFERLLNITPSLEDTLASRKARVMMRFHNEIPYTYRVLQDKLIAICGKDLLLDPNFKNYQLRITFGLDLFGEVREVQNLVREMIPANIDIVVENHLNYSCIGDCYTAVGMTATQMYQLSE